MRQRAANHSIYIDSNSSRLCRESAVDHAIAALAARQFGVVERAQLRALGLAEHEIDYRVAIGRLRKLSKGVYAVGHDRLCLEGRCLAAVFAGGEDAVLSHRSAARHWGLLTHEGAIEVTTPRPHRRRAGHRYCRSLVPPLERTVHRELPVTTVARTLLDLGTVAAPRVSKAFEQADVLGLLDVSELQHLVGEHPRRPGTRAIRAVLAAAADWRGITRSELEARFRDLLAEAGLPAPDMNRHLDFGAAVIEADAVWADSKLIVELDGYAYHRAQAAFERDRERDRVAVAAGWRVIRITWRQLANDERGVIRDLRRALSLRGPQLLRSR